MLDDVFLLFFLPMISMSGSFDTISQTL